MARKSSGGSSDAALKNLENQLNYCFSDKGLLEHAVTHSSFAYEGVVSSSENFTVEDYERLEFLGDSILNFLISEFLFQAYPKSSEGRLSQLRAFLVSARHLSEISQELGLGAFLRLSRGEEKTGGRTKKAILADLFESIIAAIYLDGGLIPVRRFVLSTFSKSFSSIAQKRFNVRDYKSMLQEELHKRNLREPNYRVILELGPDHAKEFVVELYMGSKFLARDKGSSKKEAEQRVAEKALRFLKREDVQD